MTDPWLIQNYNTCANGTAGSHSQLNGQHTEKNLEDKHGELEVGEKNCLEFEDNFTSSDNLNNQTQSTCSNSINYSNSYSHQPLPDSASYLRGLEHKLEKIKKGSKLIEALGEKRQDCLRTLLQSDHFEVGGVGDSVSNFELDAPVGQSNVQEIYRYLQPVQAVTAGELVHIVEYDQLDCQKQAETEEEVEVATDTEKEEKTINIEDKEKNC